MSNDIRAYEDISDEQHSCPLQLTATVQSLKGAIQFTIGTKWVILSQSQLLDMIGAISFRLLSKEGYSATGDIEDVITEDQKECNPDTRNGIVYDRKIYDERG